MLFPSRGPDKGREHEGKQAAALRMAAPPKGRFYDAEAGGNVAFGVTTTFYIDPPAPKLADYKPIVTKEFEEIQEKLNQGIDIIVPCGPDWMVTPDIKEWFYGTGTDKAKQIVMHNLGTGVAAGLEGWTKEHVQLIQTLLDGLSTPPASKDIAKFIDCYDPNKDNQTPSATKADPIATQPDPHKCIPESKAVLKTPEAVPDGVPDRVPDAGGEETRSDPPDDLAGDGSCHSADGPGGTSPEADATKTTKPGTFGEMHLSKFFANIFMYQATYVY